MRSVCALLAVAALCRAAVPTPKEHFGFTPGDDFKLADNGGIVSYFEKLARASDRILFVEFGRTAMGKPMYIAYISAPENLKRLGEYREISRRLALGQADESEARKLAERGKAIVWIDSGLHASEVAPSQHSPELAYRMVTGESAEIQAIRRDVILLQVPVINPDGLDMIAHWYGANVGTPYQDAPLPWLDQKYSGHDNNRDWFMLNLPETRAVTRLLFHDWFPQIVNSQGQSPPFPARILVPAYAEPLNPQIPAAVMEGIDEIGMAIKERLARENKAGVLSSPGHDAWGDGGLRSAAALHNMRGILTETAMTVFANPRAYKLAGFPERFANGLSTHESSMLYERPWMGGKWGVRDAIEYMLTADFAILDVAARRRADYLFKGYQMSRQGMDLGRRGNPYAYVIPASQWDAPTAVEMLERLAAAGVEIRRAQAPFRAGGKSYPQGSYVMLASQPFRGYLRELLEAQKYPRLSLPMRMGVSVDPIEERFEADLAPEPDLASEAVVRGDGPVVVLDHRENAQFFAVNFFLGRAENVRLSANGEIVLDTPYLENRSRVENFARQFGISVDLRAEPPAKLLYELKEPRVAIYQPWVANADEGWTEWLLDRYGIRYTLVHNEDVRKGDLRRRFDTIVLAAQTANSILHGSRDGQERVAGVQRPRYTGGIEVEGLAQLERFVRDGGTLIALDTATELPIQFFPLPVRNVVTAGRGFDSPGSLLRVTIDTSQPIGFGMPRDALVFSTGGEAFEIALAAGDKRGEGATHSVASFAKTEHALVEARYGQGHVVLFGFRPQFRGQSYGTFKLLLNAIYLGSAQRL